MCFLPPHPSDIFAGNIISQTWLDVFVMVAWIKPMYDAYTYKDKPPPVEDPADEDTAVDVDPVHGKDSVSHGVGVGSDYVDFDALETQAPRAQ